MDGDAEVAGGRLLLWLFILDFGLGRESDVLVVLNDFLDNQNDISINDLVINLHGFLIEGAHLEQVLVLQVIEEILDCIYD